MSAALDPRPQPHPQLDPFAPALADQGVDPLPASAGVSPAPASQIQGVGGGPSPYTGQFDAPADATAQKELRAAQAELARNFQIVAADAPGPRLPNQVTKAEFDKIAATYGQIQAGKADLQLNTEGLDPEAANAYRQKALADIQAIIETPSGRALIEQLANNTNNQDLDAHGNPKHHITTLYSPQNPDLDEHDEDKPGTTGPSTGAKNKSNGVGSDAIVHYQAGHWINDDYAPAAEKDFEKEGRSDIILYHELVHALHRTEGTMATGTAGDAKVAVDSDDVGISLEEYQTVGLGGKTTQVNGVTTTENEYRKERNQLAKAGLDVALPGDDTLHQRLDYASSHYEH